MLPVTALVFLAYAVTGPLLDRIGLDLIAHRGYWIARLIGTAYMTLEGIFGVPLDVAADLHRAVHDLRRHPRAQRRGTLLRGLDDWPRSADRAAAPARDEPSRLAGYLLGAVSGSGVANTVMLGAVAWPLMRRAGYPADTAGAVLAAAGIGAILAPPVMGAAAFLIAEFLHISYLEVIVMAAIPAALYYLSIFLMVEVDSRRLGAAADRRRAAVARRADQARLAITSRRSLRSWS